MIMLRNVSIHINMTIHRNYNFEHSMIQCSTVELAIRHDAHSVDYRKLSKCGFDISGNPVLCNGQILIHPNIPSMPLPFSTSTFHSYLQPWCNPILHTLSGEIVNGYPGLQAMFFYLRLAHINDISEFNNTSADLSKEDTDYGAFLGRARGITGEWNATTAPDDGSWALVPLAGRMLPDTAANIIPVYDIDGVLAYMLEIIFFDNSYVVLPRAYYQNQFYYVPLWLYIPPKPPYTLLNTNLLAAYPNAVVVLTDDVILALTNTSSPEMVYLANPGGDAWIDHLDLAPLAGRKVIYAVLNTDNREEKQQYYRTAVKMAEKLHSVGITACFAIMKSEGECQLNLWTPNLLSLSGQLLPVSLAKCNGKIIYMRKFIKSAQALNIPIPYPISRARYGAIDIADITEPVLLIENVINSNSFVVIIEHENVGQNIISSVLVNKLHNYENHMPDHWRNSSNGRIKCNVFIDAERQRQYLKLLNMLAPDYFSTATGDESFLFNTDFLSESAEDGLSTFKGALREHPAQVVVFDAESVWDGGTRSIALFKNALRHCITNDIAVVIVLRNDKLLRYLLPPDRLIHIWKNGEEKFHYIVETEHAIGEDAIEPFELWLENSTWKSETVSANVLADIPERENRNTKPGIDTSMDSLLDD